MTHDEKLQNMLACRDLVALGLPALNYRQIEQRYPLAVDETKNALRAKLQQQDAVRVREIQERYESESDQYSSDDMQRNMVVSKPTLGPPKDFVAAFVAFIEALPECLPLTLGFHISLGSDDFCFCPCGKRMRTWRAQFRLSVPECQGSNKGGTGGRAQHGGKAPKALLCHVDAKQSCVWHWIVGTYLRILYKEYWKDSQGRPIVGHKALYDVNGKACKVAERMEQAEIMRQIQYLHTLFEKEKEKAEELQRRAQHFEELAKTTDRAKDYQLEADTEDSLLKHFKLDKRDSAKKVVLTDSEKDSFSLKRSYFFDLCRRALRCRKIESTASIDLDVDHGFSLQECFEFWKQSKDESHRFLFSNLKKNECGVWLNRWNIQFSGK
jgi:hypothetical protein